LEEAAGTGVMEQPTNLESSAWPAATADAARMIRQSRAKPAAVIGLVLTTLRKTVSLVPPLASREGSPKIGTKLDWASSSVSASWLSLAARTAMPATISKPDFTMAVAAGFEAHSTATSGWIPVLERQMAGTAL